jgi:hypothetical protein
MDFTWTLTLTPRPVIDAGLFEDFGKIFTGSSKIGYGSKPEGYSFETIEKLCKKASLSMSILFSFKTCKVRPKMIIE